MNHPELHELSNIEYITLDHDGETQIVGVGGKEGKVYRYLIAIIPTVSKGELVKALQTEPSNQIEGMGDML